jgi:serine/threonine protein kinase
LAYSPEAKPTQSTPGLLPQIDPYQHIDFLGSGAYGYVDTVQRVGQPGAVFARKTIRITTGRNREVQMRSAHSEFRILQRLKHHHVMQVLEIYRYRNKLSVIMLQVAETDMKEYLEKLDEMEVGQLRHEMLKPLLMWQGCLVKAIDYLHEMRIKHKDLKPANILVKGGHVLIADFGISKDLIDEETTASRLSDDPQGSPMYMAPEVFLEGRRGRAVDIFSLGCIFLEISTCMVAGPGSRTHFAEHRNLSGSRAYARCPKQILQWFSYLWGRYAEYKVFETRRHAYLADSIFAGVSLPGELAFMMLDPDPKKRITSRQLVARIYANSTLYLDVKEKSCKECNTGSEWKDENILLHSTFHEDEDFEFALHPESALKFELDFDWEDAKRKWLASHMWW